MIDLPAGGHLRIELSDLPSCSLKCWRTLSRRSFADFPVLSVAGSIRDSAMYRLYLVVDFVIEVAAVVSLNSSSLLIVIVLH